MGIKGLTGFLSDNAPNCIKQHEYKWLLGRNIAVDASMQLYQFLIAIRDNEFANLTNLEGKPTSHVSGVLSRITLMLEQGIRPVYVFDGKPPDLKSVELEKRKLRREDAENNLAIAEEQGDQENIKMFSGRTVKVSADQVADIKKLLTILGIPFIQAPAEAEAQCAYLNKKGLVYATASEDSDSLTFGTKILIRHLNFKEKQRNAKPLLVIDLDVALTDLNLDMNQFIDLCILCGCDYSANIRGIGGSTGYKMIKEFKNIERILEILPSKYTIPENFNYNEIREYFKNPLVTEVNEIKFQNPNFEELKKFLIDDMNFSATRVETYIMRLTKTKTNVSQRIDSFFKIEGIRKSEIKKKKTNKVGGKKKN